MKFNHLQIMLIHMTQSNSPSSLRLRLNHYHYRYLLYQELLQI